MVGVTRIPLDSSKNENMGKWLSIQWEWVKWTTETMTNIDGNDTVVFLGHFVLTSTNGRQINQTLSFLNSHEDEEK